MNLEFSFVTNKEKMKLMTTIPIQQHIQYEANKIKQANSNFSELEQQILQLLGKSFD